MLMITPNEFRALQADSDTAGGYLMMPENLAKTFLKTMDDYVFIRRLATKFSVPNAQSLGIPTMEVDLGDVEWTGELLTGSADNDLSIGKRNLYPHPMARRILVSNKLLRMASVNPETIVRDRMSYKLGIVEENAFMVGNGINQPLGIFTASDVGIGTDRDISTGNTQTGISADNLIECLGHLKAPYRSGAVWVGSRTFETKLKKLKSGDGQFLFSPSLSAGAPNTLLGLPLYISEYVPDTWTSGNYVACLFNPKYYYIADSLDVQIQRLVEIAATTNQTMFICRKETDGMPVISEAFVRCTLA